ncbi:hypothetical protein ACH5RR_017333 [Cinchona calisaya]|uniref:Uncharacterized protein n=1 Tax=Cinchona calisaya TaxID=153742 RepID=A0ABD2ZYI2_9GENT
MVSLVVFRNSCMPITASDFTIQTRIFTTYPTTRTSSPSNRFKNLRVRAFVNKPSLVTRNQERVEEKETAAIVLDSLRVLEWDKVCDSVASFAGTSLGKQAAEEQLWSLNKTYEESLRLLEETNAVVEMYKYGAVMDFVGIDSSLVQSAIQCAKRDSPVTGREAMALVALLQFAEGLQFNLKTAIKKDAEWYQRFMPLSEKILELVISRSLIKFIQQLIDEDGLVKDSASSALKQSRERVQSLERKLYQLMESLIKNEMKEKSSLEVSNIDGRWCIKSGIKLQTNFEGLLLSRCW